LLPHATVAGASVTMLKAVFVKAAPARHPPPHLLLQGMVIG